MKNSGAPTVELRGVTKRFAGSTRPALDGVSFAVAEGETLVLLGSSGSGKTTSLKMVNRLVEPDEGQVFVEGREVRSWDPIVLRRRAGYVIQEVGLIPHFTVRENVELVPRLEGWNRERRSERARYLLGLVSLDPDEFSMKKPSELSGGQRQRVGVARALALDPPLLLMDEPFGALDPITRRKLQDEFLEMTQSLHKTIVFVTHDVPEAFKLGDRIGIMDEGRLIQLAPPERIRSEPASDLVRELVRTDGYRRT